ncbi:unnamed protein product [Callosobruchus maculatus]|uniref:MADF domain-containing protein n=1 Tax=Callosobruchus maculatus TaxID=64391 RepID=A0A653D6G2_CALMS|nr:unnamed protein product [Callosobruchus maculatus]
MAWDKLKSLKLIMLVQKEPCIWHPLYRHDNSLTNEAWARILVNSHFVKYSAKALKIKWYALLRKYKTCLETRATSWFAFDMMDSFLGAIYQRGPAMSTEEIRNGTPTPMSRESTSTHPNNETSLPQTLGIPTSIPLSSVLEPEVLLHVPEDVDDKLRVELMNEIGNLVHEYTDAIKRRRTRDERR